MLEDILFLDIETAPQQEHFEDLSEKWQELWSKKAELLNKYNPKDDFNTLYERAGIYAEFGKIICISCGFLTRSGVERQLRITSFYGNDEKKILEEFSSLLNKSFDEAFHRLCAHNGKEFDFPYLCRRMLVHRIPLPKILNIQGKKPWEVQHIDTLEFWKFGDYKNFTSLDTLATLFDIPSPKSDISGSDIYNVYYKQNDVERIKNYCQQDVRTLVQVYFRFVEENWLKDHQIIYK
ncbi:MAG: Uncharacterised protein [Bacteroidetes bacterium MED-G17]|nr:MAG: Uncharacterised protein [Bacteroidetes bacterium MED-G17]